MKVATPVCDVLVVDDEPELRMALVDELSFEGYRVIGVANGLEALQFPTARVVLSDLSMPKLGGVELIRALRGAGHHPAVVLMSALPEIHEIGREENVDASLMKPFDMVSLLRIVSDLVASSIKKRVE